MKTIVLIAQLAVLSVSGLQAQTDSLYLNNRQAVNQFQTPVLKAAIRSTDQAIKKDPNSRQWILDGMFLRYQLMTHWMVGRNNDSLSANYELFIDWVKQFRSNPELTSDALAMEAAITMTYLSVNPMKAPFLSMKTHELLNEAESVNAANPRIYLIRGLMFYHTPSMFGGSAEKALSIFEKAVQTYEKLPDSNGNRLGYPEACAWAGLASRKLDDHKTARKWYEKALVVNPNYYWVSKELMNRLNDGE